MKKKKQERLRYRQLVRDREKLAALSPGGTADHPIAVPSSPVIDTRVAAMPCAQCGGEYRLVDHAAPGGGLREIRVTCRICHVSRVLWFKIVPDDPN